MYRTVRPRPPLDAVVRCFWILRDDAPAGGAPFERVHPDGCSEIVFHRGDPFERRHWSERGPATQHRAAVVGQLDRWIDIRPTGRVHILGVRFRPAGAAAVLHEAAHRLTGRSLGLEEVLGAEGRALAERVLGAPTDGAAVAAIEEVLRARLRPAGPDRERVAGAVAVLEASRGSVRVAEAARRAGLGVRRLERLFREEVGLSPKRLARVLRFQEALRLLQDGAAPGIVRAAVDAGYFDQAHLHRDFLEFAGEPPGRWLAAARPMTDHFLS
jgi:AraC-like DNA-binding protein